MSERIPLEEMGLHYRMAWATALRDRDDCASRLFDVHLSLELAARRGARAWEPEEER